MNAWVRRLTPHTDLKGWLRGLGVALASGVFMAVVGAFGTDGEPLTVRLIYWLPMMLAGYLMGSFIARFFFGPRAGRRERPLRDTLTAALIMTPPFSAFVWAVSFLVFRNPIPLATMPYIALGVFCVAAAITGIMFLIERPMVETHATAAPPKFFDRLPLKLRGAEVWAVEAEDHYLRLHTSRGQDLILLRLADAVAELEGIEGMQVHRSWWVSREAIVGARRGDGRATLTLKDGSQVPVSRTYAAQLRERGWI